MMGKEFILSLMCFNDIIQTYGDHSSLFSKELFFQVQYVQNYVKRFMKISVCDDCKYFPPSKIVVQHTFLYSNLVCKIYYNPFPLQPISSYVALIGMQVKLQICKQAWGFVSPSDFGDQVMPTCSLKVSSDLLFFFIFFLCMYSTCGKRIYYWCCFVFGFLSSPFLFKSAQCVNAQLWASKF